MITGPAMLVCSKHKLNTFIKYAFVCICMCYEYDTRVFLFPSSPSLKKKKKKTKIRASFISFAYFLINAWAMNCI